MNSAQVVTICDASAAASGLTSARTGTVSRTASTDAERGKFLNMVLERGGVASGPLRNDQGVKRRLAAFDGLPSQVKASMDSASA